MTTMPPTPVYQRGDVLLALFPHSDLRTAKLRPALVVPADVFHAGLHQVKVAMISGLLFRPNHPSWVVEVVTGEALAMFAVTNAQPSAKVTFPFFSVRADGRKYSSKGIHRNDHPELLLRSAYRTGNDRSEKLDTRLVGQSTSGISAGDQCGGDRRIAGWHISQPRLGGSSPHRYFVGARGTCDH
jgi:hypothetical protein